MKAADIIKVFGTAVISQVISLLNAVYKPFEGTIFVFKDWQSIASKSAIAVGFVVVFVLAARVVTSKRPVTWKLIVGGLITSGILLAACAVIYILLASGFAPSETFLFWIRDVVWMLLYIFMLIAVGITVALGCLLMFGTYDEEASPENRL